MLACTIVLWTAGIRSADTATRWVCFQAVASNSLVNTMRIIDKVLWHVFVMGLVAAEAEEEDTVICCFESAMRRVFCYTILDCWELDLKAKRIANWQSFWWPMGFYSLSYPRLRTWTMEVRISSSLINIAIHGWYQYAPSFLSKSGFLHAAETSWTFWKLHQHICSAYIWSINLNSNNWP